MRIVFITTEYPPKIIGGAGKYSYNIVQELAELGNEIFLILPRELAKKAQSKKNVHIISAGPANIRPFKVLLFWLSLPRTIQEINEMGDIDIIHFNGPCSIIFNGIISSPSFITLHQPPIDSYHNKTSIIRRAMSQGGGTRFILPLVERKAVKKCDRIIAVSKHIKKQLVQQYDISDDKISVIYNGINPIPLPNYDRVRVLKKKYNLISKNTILFVGRVNDPIKGLDILLRALSLLEDRDTITLIIVGGGDQGSAKRLAHELGIIHQIIFTGFLLDSELANYYALADLLVCPSRSEGFGLVLLEAAEMNLPIIATNVGGIPELVMNGLDAKLVEPEPHEIAAAIRSCISDRSKSINLAKVFDWKSAALLLQNEYLKSLEKDE